MIIKRCLEQFIRFFINLRIIKFFFIQRMKLRVKRPITIKLIDGVRFLLDPRQLIDYNLYFNGVYEKYTTNTIKKLVTKDMICFDIGANIGAHTFAMAKICNKVYAFEPTTWAYDKLLINNSLNHFKNIQLLKCGLSDKTETKNIYIRSSWPLFSNPDKVEENVYFTTIDDFGLQVDFMKIDVDGYEPQILTGGIETIKKYKPIIIIEFVLNKEFIFNFLKVLGYKFYSEVTYKEINPFKNRTFNIICLPEN